MNNFKISKISLDSLINPIKPINDLAKTIT